MYLEAAKFAGAVAAIITGCMMIDDFIARGQGPYLLGSFGICFLLIFVVMVLVDWWGNRR